MRTDRCIRAGDLRRKLGSAIIVYGTHRKSGANRYAAEQWQKQFLDQFESAVRIYKDFEVTERDLADHDVLFIGRPETNSALAAWAKPLALDYDGDVFQLAGKDHSSENDAVVLAGSESAEQETHGADRGGQQPSGHRSVDARRRLRAVAIPDLRCRKAGRLRIPDKIGLWI